MRTIAGMRLVTGTTTLQGSVNWILTNNDQTYVGPVTIGSVTPFFARFELKQSGTIRFESTVDGSGAGVQPVTFLFHGATPAADVLEFDAKVGGLQSLSNITVLNGTVPNAVTININALNIANFVINTTGFQSYGGNVVLGGNATLTSTSAGGDITFGNTIDGTGSQSLTTNSAGPHAAHA